MESADLGFFGQFAEITLIDMVMSADNAVAIALACRSLPPGRHGVAFALGALGAVTFRFAFASFVSLLLLVPYLRLIAGVGLLHIAMKMLDDAEEAATAEVPAPSTVWSAVRVILMADLLLSFDNAIAVAAAADENMLLLAVGMLITAPMLIFGSRAVGLLLDRLPILVPAGAAVLGWVAGKMMVSDIAVAAWVDIEAPALTLAAPLFCAGLVALRSALQGGPPGARPPAGQELAT